ncbi:MAG: MarR family transcriptional regulator [Ruminococcus sp.]|nr:MarR family transcriptional regulator [Ruminococcus sp.]
MEDKFLYGLAAAQLSRRIERCVNRDLEESGLTLSQLRVLLYIYDSANERGEHVFQKDIETDLILSNPAVSGIIDRLEQKGLAERKVSVSDSRRKEICITEAFEKLKSELLAKNVNHEKRLLEGLSEDDKKTLQRCLKKMIANMSG